MRVSARRLRPDPRRESGYVRAVRILTLWREPWSADKLERWRAAAGETPLGAEAVLSLLHALLVEK